jgi:hypothetical protein
MSALLILMLMVPLMILVITSALSYSLEPSLLRIYIYRETESNCHLAVINRLLYL